MVSNIYSIEGIVDIHTGHKVGTLKYERFAKKEAREEGGGLNENPSKFSFARFTRRDPFCLQNRSGHIHFVWNHVRN